MELLKFVLVVAAVWGGAWLFGWAFGTASQAKAAVAPEPVAEGPAMAEEVADKPAKAEKKHKEAKEAIVPSKKVQDELDEYQAFLERNMDAPAAVYAESSASVQYESSGSVVDSNC